MLAGGGQANALEILDDPNVAVGVDESSLALTARCIVWRASVTLPKP
jgi:hypothetical protein